MISVLQLGTFDYSTALRLQQKLVELRKEGSIGDVLLLLEHTPVITLGRNAKAANVLASPEQLAKGGVEVFECDRGGDVTFHGPGQLVCYPIFDLRGFSSGDGKRKTLGAVEFVRRLEEVLIRTCADFGIATKRVPGLTGVWASPTKLGGSTRHVGTATPGGPVEPEAPSNNESAKVAAIGVHISRGVTTHGFALNVNTDLDYFNLIIPCGINSKPVTSVAKELGNPLSLEEVADSVSRNFGTVFNSQILWLETLDALLGPSVGIPMKPPTELRKLSKEEETFWA
ncbi:MAG: lipoyl(octanoyl) transferase LipB [Acidobacteria bacterium]|nr:MAG: lipoyl(octanoyl) transferase LipB [Acidobacteriota bacterium]